MLSKYSAKAILVCPYRPSSTFWPLLFKSKGEFQSFIKDVFVIEDAPKYVKLGNYFHSIVGYQNPCPTSLPYNALEGIKRIFAYSATNKSPVAVLQLYEMYNYFGTKTISLSNLRAILMCFIFCGFSTV